MLHFDYRSHKRHKKISLGASMEERNYQWFLKADLTAYNGQYVAIAHERVAASGEDPATVYETAKTKYPDEEVLLWKVMPSGVFVFFHAI